MVKLVGLAIFLACALTANASQAAADNAGKIPVVATFSILADFVSNVGGDGVTVAELVGPNGDAHVYQPKPADAKALREARIILVNGLGLEGWIDRLIKASGSKAPVIIASKGITPQQMEENGHVGLDPHAWQSITNAITYVTNIRDGLIAADLGRQDYYRANAAAYIDKLHALEKQVSDKITQIPPERRRIITTHDAFGYFGRAYGFSFIAPVGVSTEAEASARDVARIINQIKTTKVPAVFLENVTDPRLLKRIADESGAKIGGTLYSDALSPPDGEAPTYIEMMRHNIDVLTVALTQ
ncbi:MAG TPA: metal ABC transporter substrate-binding protein [Methylocella sp.]|nr:metal ABC transporter substrate-binding protein [Methylocella sp.]